MNYEEILERALEEEIGLDVEITNAPQFQTNIAGWREKYGHGRYDSLMVCLPGIPNHVYIVKKSVELE